MKPGEIIVAAGEIVLNEGRETVTVTVANSGDRPVQVGSHYHFYETNAALRRHFGVVWAGFRHLTAGWADTLPRLWHV